MHASSGNSAQRSPPFNPSFVRVQLPGVNQQRKDCQITRSLHTSGIALQVRHSRVTAVWDDEPVPAVPSPLDHTPAVPAQPALHTSQACQRGA